MISSAWEEGICVFQLQESDKPKLALRNCRQGCPRTHAGPLGPSPLCPLPSLCLPTSFYSLASSSPTANGFPLLLGTLTPNSPQSLSWVYEHSHGRIRLALFGSHAHFGASQHGHDYRRPQLASGGAGWSAMIDRPSGATGVGQAPFPRGRGETGDKRSLRRDPHMQMRHVRLPEGMQLA